MKFTIKTFFKSIIFISAICANNAFSWEGCTDPIITKSRCILWSSSDVSNRTCEEHGVDDIYEYSCTGARMHGRFPTEAEGMNAATRAMYN